MPRVAFLLIALMLIFLPPKPSLAADSTFIGEKKAGSITYKVKFKLRSRGAARTLGGTLFIRYPNGKTGEVAFGAKYRQDKDRYIGKTVSFPPRDVTAVYREKTGTVVIKVWGVKFTCRCAKGCAQPPRAPTPAPRPEPTVPPLTPLTISGHNFTNLYENHLAYYVGTSGDILIHWKAVPAPAFPLRAKTTFMSARPSQYGLHYTNHEESYSPIDGNTKVYEGVFTLSQGAGCLAPDNHPLMTTTPDNMGKIFEKLTLSDSAGQSASLTLAWYCVKE